MVTRLSADSCVFLGVVGAVLATAAPAWACPEEPYIGAICSTAAPKCPTTNYVKAEGQVLTIASNAALYSLLGSLYGGDGKTTFALPDLRARAPVGGILYNPTGVKLAQQLGAESVTLTVDNLPPHTHQAALTNFQQNVFVAVPQLMVAGDSTSASSSNPTTATPYLGGNPTTRMWAASVADPVAVNGLSVSVTGTPSLTVTNAVAGGGAPLPTISPQIGVTYCIAVSGLYPPRP